ncbi:uncharacterized protein BDZ83DRAFT_640103 [Colletotrichum acutatum]|uniref:Uncharacterized protein n=1 Tax=Glomerella acutata TaxID=27357 RepID=A0AAD8U9Q5_GLOAC|nr:uncharacterized protein BDZ83DRAFT_640103 [Colletotrichum acutatum]KAK1710892.1 hypothetical protein BDZ83DRAFT_640103 [Colletotrichum acutatum]
MAVRKLVGCLESSSDLTRHRLGSCDAGFSVLTVPTSSHARYWSSTQKKGAATPTTSTGSMQGLRCRIAL